MIGERYWSTGIVTRHWAGHGWSAWADFLDDGFCSDDAEKGVISTQGRVTTRYFVKGDGGLTAAIDAVKRDAERLGVEFRTDTHLPYLYYDGDGENPDWPPPAGWREELARQAARIGWAEPYSQ